MRVTEVLNRKRGLTINMTRVHMRNLQTCPVDERDVTAVATGALLDDAHVGKA